MPTAFKQTSASRLPAYKIALAIMLPAWLMITAGILYVTLQGEMAVLVGIVLAIPDLLWLSGIIALTIGIRRQSRLSLAAARVVLPLTLVLDIFLAFVLANIALSALYLNGTAAGTFIDLLILLGGALLLFRITSRA